VSADFVGVGIAFPPQLGPTGGLALVSDVTEIEQAIHLILATAPGERPMRPDFVCGIHDYVFAPADATTAGHVAYEVTVALERWEPRVDLVDVRVAVAPDEPSTLYITVVYTMRGRYDPRNLVFPFYVIPPEP
jgi:phage baseplate assembly protein W